MTPSARPIRSSSSAIPSSDLRSMAIERRLRPRTPPLADGMGRSTRTTSAPMSASIMAQKGPAPSPATSTMRTPRSGPPLAPNAPPVVVAIQSPLPCLTNGHTVANRPHRGQTTSCIIRGTGKGECMGSRDPVIVGIGWSDYPVVPELDAMDHHAQALRRALADCGLEKSDIDGYMCAGTGFNSNVDDAPNMAEYLQINHRW